MLLAVTRFPLHLHRYRVKSAKLHDQCRLRSLYRSSLVICVPDFATASRANNDPFRRQLRPPAHRVKPIYEDIPRETTSSTKKPPPTYPLQPSSYTAARQEIPNRDAEYTIYPKYSYNYGVLDGSTGDTKTAWEERDGDSVRGEYSVVEPDGTVRTVSYTADDESGFKAVITKKKSSLDSEVISRMAAKSALVPILLARSAGSHGELRYPQHRYD
ncbi:uncharacterized protein LOC106643680 [Copidosoma floridanum]|uniref:uncharacterized protein LOC106643680 n=1 Tax=Copidosoma floridanum TaxID=29053 RepID=UPI0006C971B9|nr:uncharacterized protein LOC106643680 [Copidosoma floridanum]